MSRKKLPQRERDICIRLRNARLAIGKSQEYVASRIGIERSTLTNYESEVSPVRWEIALRFCRQLIVSEEWIATGLTTSVEESAVKQGVINDTDRLRFRSFFMRHCVDLLSDPIAIKLRPGMLFSDAFDEHLGVRYKQLVAEFFQMPRIVFSQNRETDLAEELVACMAERWFKLLNEEALKHKQDAWVLQRGFVHRLVGAGDKVFWDFAGGPGAAYHTELSISSMGESPSSVPLRSTDQSHKATRLGLDSVHEVVNSQDMKAQWPLLKKRLQKAAQPVGTKSKLAEFLGVKIASVSQWLSDSDSQREPGAETTLQLLKWVELQERQAK